MLGGCQYELLGKKQEETTINENRASQRMRLHKEIYADARAIHNDVGKGNNGFLGIVMERGNLPIHLGPQLDHVANASYRNTNHCSHLFLWFWAQSHWLANTCK